jgi:hypothetical protein
VRDCGGSIWARSSIQPAHSLKSGAGAPHSTTLARPPTRLPKSARFWTDTVSGVIHQRRKRPPKSAPPSALRPPPSVLRPPPSALRPPPSVLRPPPSALRPPSSALRPPSSVLRHPPSAIRPPPSALRPPPSALRPPSSALRPPPSVLRPPSSALRPPPSALRPPPSVLRPPPSVLRPPTSDLRPPTSDLRPPSSALRPPPSVLRPPPSVLRRADCPISSHTARQPHPAFSDSPHLMVSKRYINTARQHESALTRSPRQATEAAAVPSHRLDWSPATRCETLVFRDTDRTRSSYHFPVCASRRLSRRLRSLTLASPLLRCANVECRWQSVNN